MAKSDPQGEIERSAARHRARVDRTHAQRARAAATGKHDAAALRERHERETRSWLLDSSLGGGRWAGVALIATITVCLVGSIVALGFVLPNNSNLQLLGAFGGAIVILALCFAVARGELALIAALRRRRVRRIGRGFDVPRYFGQLSEKRDSGQVIVRLGFVRVPDAKASIADAVAGWMPELDAAWQAEELQITSHPIKTTVLLPASKYSSGHWEFTNAPLHMCLLGILDRVVPKLDAATHVDRIAVEIAGTVLAWDAKLD